MYSITGGEKNGMISNGRNRVWLDINLATLKDNFRRIKEAVAPSSVIGVIKANAYGLGMPRIAEALVDAGVSGFGVAELNEALDLKALGKPVQILGGILPGEIPSAIEADIIIPVTDLETAGLISKEAVKQGRTADCQFLIDTGMGRLGMLWKRAVEDICEAVKLPNLSCSGIYSHFPVAYQTGGEFTGDQVKAFLKILEDLKNRGISFERIHIANSDAINNFPYTYQFPFNYVRTGINLHGSFDNEGKRVLNLKSILTLKTRLAAIRTLPAGSTVGYGRTYKLLRDTKVGTISAGYADGLPLALSNRGYVLIKGHLCPILGRVSMDYTSVSLEGAPEARVGDEVICLGGNGVHAITVEDWAMTKGTHAYDIICSFGSRVARHYIEG
jgi:alanine racemase